MREVRVQLFLTALIVAACAYLGLPIPNKPGFRPGEPLERFKIVYGIDVQGGAELTYRMLWGGKPPKNPGEATREAANTLMVRVNTKGLAEPNINTHGEDRIILQLPGIEKAKLEEYKKLLGTMGKLEWREVGDRAMHDKVGKTDVAPDPGWKWEEVEDRKGLEAPPPEAGRDEDAYDTWPGASEGKIIIRELPILRGNAIVGSIPDSLGNHVTFTLTNEGGEAFQMATKKLVAQKPRGRIAIVVDGKVLSYPRVNDVIGKEGIIQGNFEAFASPNVTDKNLRAVEGAKTLSIILRSGSLNYPIGSLGANGVERPNVPESEAFVGPSLGQDSILRGLYAMAVASGIVALFMLVYYRGLGVIAVASLLINLVLIMAIMALFSATLTLAGMAGLVLTIGMAVDANILVYERMREEMAKGKTPVQAFEQGHERAFATIVDSNLTTFFIGIVLYWFATGPVRGFAVTLMIGILTTLISVLFFGKILLKAALLGGMIRECRMMQVMATPNFQFMKYAKTFAFISLFAVAGCAYFIWSQGGLDPQSKIFGIDFKGGFVVSFRLKETMAIDVIRSQLEALPDPEKPGLPKYAEVSVQTIQNPEAEKGGHSLQKASNAFQVRTSLLEGRGAEELEQDIVNIMGDKLSHPPFGRLAPTDIPDDPEFLEVQDDRYKNAAGCKESGTEHEGHLERSGFFVYFVDEKDFDKSAAEKAIVEAADPFVSRGAAQEQLVHVKWVDSEDASLLKARVLFAKLDVESTRGDRLPAGVQDRLRDIAREKNLALSVDPFLYKGSIGPAVAEELKNDSLLSLLVSSLLMIGYIWVRFFRSLRFGVAAVIPLVHDAAIAIGVMALCNAFVPKTSGINFEINMPAVAAFLTIIGYSINDTIVIFDRIRENLILMKKESFAEVINVSVNQTLSRTILTSLTVLMSVVILFGFTMRSSGGIANFSFPMIAGVVVGSYSTIYVAAALLVAFYKGKRPQLEK